MLKCSYSKYIEEIDILCTTIYILSGKFLVLSYLKATNSIASDLVESNEGYLYALGILALSETT